MKIIYFYGEEWEERYVGERLKDYRIEFLKGPIQDHSDFGDKDAEVLSVFVKSTIDKDVMDRFPNLKLIATRSTGFDHIDLAEAKARGITVSNVPAYGANTVAEFAFALLLTLSRKIYDAYDQIEETGSFSQVGLRGFDLAGKTIGIIGTGSIGRHAVHMAKGFAMNVIAYDAYPNEDFAKEAGFTYVSLDELLAQSDIISIHVPYFPETHNMINVDNYQKIKRGAYLINTARGQIVETEAIVRALREEVLAGAGLDVLEEEGVMMGDETELLIGEHPNAEQLKKVLSNHYLIDHPRVIITPHNAFNTQEAIERILDTTADNIEAFKGGNPANVVATKD